MKRRRRPFGLRARLLAALLFTSAVTLGAAALVLLPSLQDRLERQNRSALRATIRTAADQIREALRDDGNRVGQATADAADSLAGRTNATVQIWDDTYRRRYPSSSTVNTPQEIYTTVRTGGPVSRSLPDGTSVALRISPRGDQPFALQLVQSNAAVSKTVDAVRDAFIVAAAIGLLAALVLGIGLSATLSRRLARLRTAARRLAQEGPTAPPPSDHVEDEIGDLSRAFAAMQVALRRQENARRAFVATASHELRTPLTSLQGNFELLAEDLEGGALDVDVAREQVRAARGQLRRLSNLATELLDLSRLDAEVELRSEPVALDQIARAVTAEFELVAADSGLEVKFVEPSAPIWARGDPGAVARIVRILIDNALRFAPTGEPVLVETSYGGEQAIVTVSDRGPGVPEAEREAIFERFQRGSRTGGEHGFGLGLAIGRELATRLEGTLTLESTEPGASFRLALPIEQPS